MTAEEIAKGLTEAQREAVATGVSTTESDSLALWRAGLLRRDLRCRAPVFTTLGLAVRQLLEQPARKAGG